MSRKIDMIGKKFGKLTPVAEDGHLGPFLAYKCLCDCGNTVTVRGPSLRTGNTTSCGCVHKAMVNPNTGYFNRYGGRGITVCDEWRDFEKFYADMGDRPQGMTLERIDNNGPYSKENCRWATLKEQARNTRRTHLVEHNGKKQCLKDWANEVGLAYNTLRKRFVIYNWPFEKAISTPARPYSLAR